MDRGINFKLVSCLNWLQDNHYISQFNQKDFTGNNLLSSTLTDKCDPKDNYAILYDFEIEKIMNYKTNLKINKGMLLLLLSYVRAFTWKRINSISGHSEKSKKEKPEVFITNHKTITYYLGIKTKMINTLTEILHELGLINMLRPPRFKDSEGNWHTDNLIYVCPYRIIKNNDNFIYDEDYDSDKELQYGIDFLMDNREKKFNQ